MKIAIIDTQKSFLPELSAYINHLKLCGHTPLLMKAENDVITEKNLDLVIRFAGYLKAIKYSKLPEIHNYNSASTGSFPKAKDIFKSIFASKTIGRIFLNEVVKSNFHFTDKAPYIYRDMGADESFFKSRKSREKLYDLVYCGSISGRLGLIQELCKLSSAGFKIGLAGNATDEQYKIIKLNKNIDYIGAIKYENAADFIAKGRFGLNYCPNVYPFNIQTSTKAIEYLAAGIGIVSNKYKWIDEHSIANNYEYLNLDVINNPSNLELTESLIMKEDIARQFEWNNLLTKCKFNNFVESTIS